jgi:hypothetical protein
MYRQEPVVVERVMPVQDLMHQELRVVLADLLEGAKVVMAGHQPVLLVRMEHRSGLVVVMASPGRRLQTVVLEPTDRSSLPGRCKLLKYLWSEVEAMAVEQQDTHRAVAGEVAR